MTPLYAFYRWWAQRTASWTRMIPQPDIRTLPSLSSPRSKRLTTQSELNRIYWVGLCKESARSFIAKGWRGICDRAVRSTAPHQIFNIFDPLKLRTAGEIEKKNVIHLLRIDLIKNSFSVYFRCCCFFKRKKKKSPRQKWLDSQKSPEREAAVTLLRATSHSNSRDSCLNPSQDYIQASSQHNIRYPSASVLTSTPTNNTPTLPI